MALDLELRKTYLGGTDLVVLLNLSEYKSPLELWHEKRNPEPAQEFKNKFTEWGKKLEPFIFDIYAEENNCQVIEYTEMPQHPKYPFIRCNPDRKLIYPDGTVKIGEGKTTVRSVIKTWDGYVPDAYHIQLQDCMGLTGIDKGVFVVGVLDQREIMAYEVDLDRNYIEEVWEYAAWWWKRHIIGGKEPDLNARDTESLRPLEHKAVEANAGIIDIVSDWREVKEKIKSLEDERDQLADKIKTYIGDASTLTLDGKNLCTYRGQSRNGIDTKAFEEQFPGLLDPFKKVSHFRVLR